MTRTEIHTRFCELFASPGPMPIPLQQLVAAESELGTKLPQSYVDFATRFGAVKTPELLNLMTGGESEIAPEGARRDIRRFLPAEEIVEATRVYWSGGMEDWLIAIASDCMGNVFGFRKMNGETRSGEAAVFFFDHDFCKIKEEEAGFDVWLESFVRIEERRMRTSPRTE